MKQKLLLFMSNIYFMMAFVLSENNFTQNASEIQEDSLIDEDMRIIRNNMLPISSFSASMKNENVQDVYFDNPAKSKKHSRKKRFVVFPEGSSFSVSGK